MAEASPAEILKIQQKLDVVRDDRMEHGGNQVVVVLGTQEQPLEPPAIDVLVIPSAQPHRISSSKNTISRVDGVNPSRCTAVST